MNLSCPGRPLLFPCVPRVVHNLFSQHLHPAATFERTPREHQAAPHGTAGPVTGFHLASNRAPRSLGSMDAWVATLRRLDGQTRWHSACNVMQGGRGRDTRSGERPRQPPRRASIVLVSSMGRGPICTVHLSDAVPPIARLSEPARGVRAPFDSPLDDMNRPWVRVAGTREPESHPHCTDRQGVQGPRSDSPARAHPVMGRGTPADGAPARRPLTLDPEVVLKSHTRGRHTAWEFTRVISANDERARRRGAVGDGRRPTRKKTGDSTRGPPLPPLGAVFSGRGRPLSKNTRPGNPRRAADASATHSELASTHSVDKYDTLTPLALAQPAKYSGCEGKQESVEEHKEGGRRGFG